MLISSSAQGGRRVLSQVECHMSVWVADLNSVGDPEGKDVERAVTVNGLAVKRDNTVVGQAQQAMPPERTGAQNRRQHRPMARRLPTSSRCALSISSISLRKSDSVRRFVGGLVSAGPSSLCEPRSRCPSGGTSRPVPPGLPLWYVTSPPSCGWRETTWDSTARSSTCRRVMEELSMLYAREDVTLARRPAAPDLGRCIASVRPLSTSSDESDDTRPEPCDGLELRPCLLRTLSLGPRSRTVVRPLELETGCVRTVRRVSGRLRISGELTDSSSSQPGST